MPARANLLGLIAILLAMPRAAAQFEIEDGFQSLFDGENLDGWIKEGPAGFVAQDGMLVCNGSGNWPTWLRTSEVFENFVLRLEYRTRFGAESGVFFSAPLHGRVAHVGYEVQIGGAGGTRVHSTGAIFDAVAPAEVVKRNPDAEAFDAMEITMNWPRLQVRINEQLLHDLDVREHETLRYRPRLGYIGLQDRGKPVHFRHLRIRRLPDQVRTAWKSLIHDPALPGWSQNEGNSATWSCAEGEVLGSNGHGYLISDESYRNCELETYVRSSPLANGGIFLRWLSERDRGFEIQIEDIPDSNDPTGSIYNHVRADVMPFTPGEWALMQVFLEEQHCVVRMNGVIVAKSDQMKGARAGRLALQMHTGQGSVRWKDLRVRTLPVPPEQRKAPAPAVDR